MHIAKISYDFLTIYVFVFFFKYMIDVIIITEQFNWLKKILVANLAYEIFLSLQSQPICEIQYYNSPPTL